MAINIQYQNPTIPLAVGGYMDARRIAYQGGRAEEGSRALAQQRSNQAAGAQQFSNQMYGLANMAIQQEYQTQRDTQNHTQAMQRSAAETQQAMNLYRNNAAVRAGFYGAEGIEPWQQLEQTATAAGKTPWDFVDQRALDSKAQELQTLGPIIAQQRMVEEQQRQQVREQAGMNDQAMQMATPEERTRLSQLNSSMLQLRSPNSAEYNKWTPAERQNRMEAIQVQLDRSYGTILAREPETIQQKYDSGQIMYKAKDGTVISDPNYKITQSRATNIPTSLEQIYQAQSDMEYGSPEWEMLESQRTAYVANENDRRLTAFGVQSKEELDSFTLDEHGFIKSANKKDPMKGGYGPEKLAAVAGEIKKNGRDEIVTGKDGVKRTVTVEITEEEAMQTAVKRLQLAQQYSSQLNGGTSGSNATSREDGMSRLDLLQSAMAALSSGNRTEYLRLKALADKKK